MGVPVELKGEERNRTYSPRQKPHLYWLQAVRRIDMSQYRNALPQLSEDLYLTDAGVETDLIFNHGVEIREFALHTLLADSASREAVANYFRGFLSLADKHDVGLILDSATWKAHMHWSGDLGENEQQLRQANEDSIRFTAGLRREFSANIKPIVLNGSVGPRGDAYAPDADVAAHEAEEYHEKQIGWLAATEVDMITAMTFTQSGEAIGVVRAARSAGLPVVVSFTVETDGNLPNGESLSDAIRAVDEATDAGTAYFMLNCAHPEHFSHVLRDADLRRNADWVRRIRGLRCNASRQSHAELDECEVLDDGDPHELGEQYLEMANLMPWMNVFGACCGADLRHVARIVEVVSEHRRT
jgi:S-methylmethionine-dependent homocysteine/selenocysteine methylase